MRDRDLKLFGGAELIEAVPVPTRDRNGGTAVAERPASLGLTQRVPAPFNGTALRQRRPERTIRVVLAYRHTLLRQALKHLLLAQPEVEVVGEVADGKDAVETTEKYKPDLVIMDLALPIIDGVEATKLIRRRVPSAKVILLTMGASDEDLVRALQAGVSGCLVKDADSAELSLAITAVNRGATYLSPTISERAIQSFLCSTTDHRSQVDPLSVREREVLQLIVDGLSNQEIANKLYLSVKTVEAHKAHIMRKLNIRGRTELIKYAIRKGLISIEG